MNINARVASGAEWLDKVRPGWEHDIDLSVLDLSNGCRCIIGQVVAASTDTVEISLGPAIKVDRRDEDGLWALVGDDDVYVITGFLSVYRFIRLAGGEKSWAVDHGFLAANDSHSGEWKELDEAWISLIKNRFDTGSLSNV